MVARHGEHREHRFIRRRSAVVAKNETKTISGHTFVGFGSSHDSYSHAYMTAACAVGLGEAEMNEFFARLEKSLKDYCAKRDKDRKRRAKNSATEVDEDMSKVAISS